MDLQAYLVLLFLVALPELQPPFLINLDPDSIAGWGQGDDIDFIVLISKFLVITSIFILLLHAVFKPKRRLLSKILQALFLSLGMWGWIKYAPVLRAFQTLYPDLAP